jgi:hypothetical protein
VLCSPPRLGERISRILEEALDGEITGALKEAEDAFFGRPEETGPGSPAPAPWSWDTADLENSLRKAGFRVQTTVLERQEERLVTAKDLDNWFNGEKSAWGAFMAEKTGPSLEKIRLALEECIHKGPLLWKWKCALLKTSR